MKGVPCTLKIVGFFEDGTEYEIEDDEKWHTSKFILVLPFAIFRIVMRGILYVSGTPNLHWYVC